jgi:hypothetical protein
MRRLCTKTWFFPWLAIALAPLSCNDEPGSPEIDPSYRTVLDDDVTSGERGSMMINEINFAGSVDANGNYDPDDVFVELWNKHPRPVRVSGWRLEVRGDYHRTYRIPDSDRLLYPNEYFVIARKRDGAFADIADVFIDDLRLGKKYVELVLRDADRRLMEHAGSSEERAFSGGWDTVSVRSMERAQVLFGNRGGSATNWHAYSQDTGFSTIGESHRAHTLGSPGASNSPDYSGNSSSGNFE